MKIAIKKSAVFIVFALLFCMRTVRAAAFDFSGNENGPHDIGAAFIYFFSCESIFSKAVSLWAAKNTSFVL